MKNKIGLLLLVIFLFQGCIIHSLYPFYTSETIILDKNLEGFWENPDASKNENCPEGLLFEKNEEDDFYHLTICENGLWSKLDVHLVRIGEYTYLDFYPDRSYSREKGKENDIVFTDFHLISTHSISRVTISENNLSIESINMEWLKDLFEQRKIRIKHEKIEEGIVLTASSKDLQKFIYKYSDEEKAFESADVYEKKK